MAAAITIEKVDRPELAKHDSSILDLVFVMDCTGSMGSYIDSARENIRSIVEEIVVSEKSDVRIALIEYRDHPPQDMSFVTRDHDFTSKVNDMRGWLDNCTADGGGDAPEAVADGLHAVLKLSWRNESTKICVLIADAPPHGLNAFDSFPNGCPNGFDPVKIVREMAAKHITLYVVGVEPSIVPYRDFFMSLAYITGGQYVPMVNAKLLAQVIVGGVREEITLERLMQSAQDDIAREMQRAEAEGADESEKIKRINNIFSSKNIRSQQMNNTFGAFTTLSTACYSTCADMNEMRHQFATHSSATTGGSFFGAPTATPYMLPTTTGLSPFGGFGTTAIPSTTSPFGGFGTTAIPSTTSPFSGFGTTAIPSTTSPFGATVNTASTSGFSFGAAPASSTTSPFGSSSNMTPTSGFSFGAAPTTSTTTPFGSSSNMTPTSGFSFGAAPASSTTSPFGATVDTASTSGFSFGAAPTSSTTTSFGSSSNMTPTSTAYANQTYELTEQDFSAAQATRIYQKWQHRQN